jgi:outer membrane protein assembly factor BamB
MTRSQRVSLSVSVLALAVALCVPAVADWPQFQGPNRDGHAVDQGVSRTWPEGGPNVVWSVPLGEGFAGPAVVDGEVYILDRVDSERDVLRCLDLATGKELWTYSNDAPGKTGFNGSRGTPTVAEKHVYAVGALANMVCVDRKSHELVWKRDLIADFGGVMSIWGVAQNPVLHENLVIVAPHGPDAFVVALDKDTGNEVWRSEGMGGPAYCSPALVTVDGVKQVVMLAPPRETAYYPQVQDTDEDPDKEEYLKKEREVPDGDGESDWELQEDRENDEDEGADEGEEGDEDAEEEPPATVAGLSLEDGKVLWAYQGWTNRLPIPYPVQLSENRLFVTGGHNGGSVMLQVTRNGDAFAVKQLFKLDQEDCGSYIHQPILHEGHLYANSNTDDHQGGLTCLTLDGKVLWRTSDKRGLPRFELGNLLMADGLIVDFDGRKGTLHLIDPSPEGYRELARARIFRGSMMWAPMAMSQGKLLVRNQKEMKCVDLRNP